MNNKVKQFIAFGACSVVALILCIVVLVVTVNNLGDGANTSENKTIINKTELDLSKETLVTYINSIVSDTSDRFVKTKTYTDVSVNDITVLNDISTKEADVSLLNFAKDKILSSVDGYYGEDAEGTFVKDNSKKLSVMLKENFLENTNFSIGQVDENGENLIDDNGNIVDEEFYYLTFNIKGENVLKDKKLSKMFSTKNDLSAKEQFVNAIKADCIVKNFDSKPDSFTIKAKVNRSNDEIQYINVIRNYIIKLDAEFINSAEAFGEKEISFIYTVNDTYEYAYAGIAFVEDAVTVNYNEEYMLNVNAVIDNDSEYSVEFTSSDENIASVDEMGYVKALKNCDVPVTITVKLNYLGETFTDTCVVNVSDE